MERVGNLPCAMRILQVIHSVDPRGGGVIEGIKQLAGPMIAAGHRVEVLSLDAPVCLGQAIFLSMASGTAGLVTGTRQGS